MNMAMAPHGADPIGIAIVIVGAIATAFVFALAIRWSMHPGEDDPAHIKRLVLRDDR